MTSLQVTDDMLWKDGPDGQKSFRQEKRRRRRMRKRKKKENVQLINKRLLIQMYTIVPNPPFLISRILECGGLVNR